LGLGTTVQAVPFQDSMRVLLLSPSPTAVHARAETQDTPLRPTVREGDPGLGLGTMVQAVPFQDSMRVLSATPLDPPDPPTAVHTCAETQETLLSRSNGWAAGRLGLGTTLQAVPFQDSMRVFWTVWLDWKPPTAVHACAEAQDTLSRMLTADAGPALGLGTTVHLVPFQVSTNVRPRRLWNPTAVHAVGPVQDTP
jgi:hypothetical protein